MLSFSKVVEITHEFSFAYIQEAFVAALLAIAAQDEGDVGPMKKRIALQRSNLLA